MYIARISENSGSTDSLSHQVLWFGYCSSWNEHEADVLYEYREAKEKYKE